MWKFIPSISYLSVYFNSHNSINFFFSFADISTGEESCKSGDPSGNKRRRQAGIIIIKWRNFILSLRFNNLYYTYSNGVSKRGIQRSCPGLLQLLQRRKLMINHKMKIRYCFGASPLALNSDFALAPPFPPFDWKAPKTCVCSASKSSCGFGNLALYAYSSQQ